MSKQAKRRAARQPSPGRPVPSFTPVPVRARHDGWTDARQSAFVEVLAQTACVEEACREVGMSPRSYYTLRVRSDAESFRRAADAALDMGLQRLGDAVLGRAINGVARPVYYGGEQIGEYRRYDERLALYLLRVRAPERYGVWRERLGETPVDPDAAGKRFAEAKGDLALDLMADATGRTRPGQAPAYDGSLSPDAFDAARKRWSRQRQSIIDDYQVLVSDEAERIEDEPAAADPAPAVPGPRHRGAVDAGEPAAGDRSAHFVNFRASTGRPPPRDDGGGGSG